MGIKRVCLDMVDEMNRSKPMCIHFAISTLTQCDSPKKQLNLKLFHPSLNGTMR